MNRSPTAVIAFVALVLSSSVHACQPPGAPICTVVASPGRVVASFPILNPPFIWRWLRSETRENDLEYRWQVEFGQCGSDSRFNASEYAYGVQLFKYAGSTPRSGQLQALLSAAQHTFVHREVLEGKIVYTMIPRAEVTSRIQGSALEVTVSGREEVAQMLARLPKQALLTVDIPAQGASYRCFAEVQYAQ